MFRIANSTIQVLHISHSVFQVGIPLFSTQNISIFFIRNNKFFFKRTKFYLFLISFIYLFVRRYEYQKHFYLEIHGSVWILSLNDMSWMRRNFIPLWDFWNKIFECQKFRLIQCNYFRFSVNFDDDRNTMGVLCVTLAGICSCQFFPRNFHCYRWV